MQLRFVQRVDVPLVDMTRFEDLETSPPVKWTVSTPTIGYSAGGLVALVVAIIGVMVVYRQYCRGVTKKVVSTLVPPEPVAMSKLLVDDVDLQSEPISSPYRSISEALRQI